MSSSSLSGLVNQLHSMENSFTQILMEATMRLSSLTDASVFLLLETPEGRRYCGKRHLCDIYKTQGLCPMENEVEMELVPGVSTLQVRRQPPFHPTDSSFSQPHSSSSSALSSNSSSTTTQPLDPTHQLPSHQQEQQQHHPHLHQAQMTAVSYSATGSGAVYRKRSSDDLNSEASSSSSSSSSPRKLMRTLPNVSSQHNSHHPQLYQPYDVQPMTVGLGPGPAMASSSTSMITPDVASTTSTTTNSGVENVGFACSDVPSSSSSCEGDAGEVVFVDVKREGDGNPRCIANTGGESYLDDQTGDRIQKMDGLQLTTATSNQMANALGCKGDVFLDSFARKAAVDQLSLEEKLEIMKGLPPESLLKQGAVDTEEYLIFQKVCYEFCRACALECPMDEADVDAYFDANFNAFANIFPKLNTNVDVLYHMRLLTKRSYKQYLKTRGKRKNDHSKMATFFS